MLRTFELNGHTIFERSAAEDRDQSTRLTAASWIDAEDPTADERSALARFLSAELPESDDVEEIESSARYFVDADRISSSRSSRSPQRCSCRRR